MIAVSYVFYGAAGWTFTLLIVASTVVNQFCAVMVSRGRGRARTWWLVVAIVADLGILGWFKYYGFFVSSLDNLLGAVGSHSSLPLLDIVLPVGVSFLTFRAISYVIDVYRGKIEPGRHLDVALYFSFFPHLMAGPDSAGCGSAAPARQPARPAPHRLRPGALADLRRPGQEDADRRFSLAHRRPRLLGSRQLLRARGRCSASTATRCRSTATSAATPISPSARASARLRPPGELRHAVPARQRAGLLAAMAHQPVRWLRDYLYIPLGGSRKVACAPISTCW